MSPDTLPAPPREEDPVRVSVTGGRRRVDLVLPGATPVGELVPELAHGTGLLDHATAHLGAHLATSEGAVLAGSQGLRVQGVRDGAVLAVAVGAAEPHVPLYDDVGDAVADVVEHELACWSRTTRRATTHVVAGLALGLGAVALVASRGVAPPLPSGLGALVVALLLLLTGALLSRVGHDLAGSVVSSLGGVGYAAVAGVLLTAGDGSLVDAAPGGAVGAVLAGLLALAALDAGRLLMLAPVLAGSAVLGLALATRLTGVGAAEVAAWLIATLVVVSGLVPRVALAVAGLRVERPGGRRAPVDAARVGSEARLALELVVALSGGAGLALVVLGSVAITGGPSGAAVVAAAGGVVLARSRQHRSRAAVLVGVASAVAALVVPGVVLAAELASWRPALAGVAATAGLAGLAAAMAPDGRLGCSRAADLLEALALVALLPLTAWAGGLLEILGG